MSKQRRLIPIDPNRTLTHGQAQDLIKKTKELVDHAIATDDIPIEKATIHFANILPILIYVELSNSLYELDLLSNLRR